MSAPSAPPSIGFAIPQTYTDPQASIDRLEQFFVEVEQAGIDSLWVQEQLLGHDQSFEPLAMLAFAAARTRSPRLGTAAIIAPLRNAVSLAKTLATIDQLSRGRLTVGLALGDALGFYRAMGLDATERVARLEEAVDVMRRLWTDDRVTFDGRFCHLEDAPMEPKPVQAGGPPIWLGAHRPPALRRAVHLGSGFIGAGAASVEAFAAQATLVREELARSERRAEGFTIAKKVYLAADRDPDAARRGLTEWFRIHWGAHDGEALAAKVGVAGTPAEVLTRLRAVRRAGGELLILNPVFDEMRQFRILSDEVIPQLRAG